MVDKVSFIKENGEVVGFRVNDKEFYLENGCFAEVQVNDLNKAWKMLDNIGSVPP